MTKQNKKAVDSIKLNVNKNAYLPKISESSPQKNTVVSSVKIQVTDNKIPARGLLWYIIFTIVFLGSAGLIIYLRDWALLFFVIVFSGVTLWRGNKGAVMDLEVGSDGVKVNNKTFLLDEIESFYFSRIGEDFTITFQMMKKYLPRLTFIFIDYKYLEQIRQRINDKVPEREPREESYVDLLIRKLKL